MFIYIFVLGLISLFIIVLKDYHHEIQFYGSSFTAIGSALCFSITPSTNKARNNKEKKMFSILHTISVIITISILLVNALWLTVI